VLGGVVAAAAVFPLVDDCGPDESAIVHHFVVVVVAVSKESKNLVRIDGLLRLQLVAVPHSELQRQLDPTIGDTTSSQSATNDYVSTHYHSEAPQHVVVVVG
jgi:hypothetical protein